MGVVTQNVIPRGDTFLETVGTWAAGCVPSTGPQPSICFAWGDYHVRPWSMFGDVQEREQH